MKINDIQYKWLKLLYKCWELRMVRLDSDQLQILNRVINSRIYIETYDQVPLNSLRDTYKISDLTHMMGDHKSRWGKFTAGGSSFQYNSKMIIGTSSGIHPTHNQYYVRKPGKVIVSGTGGNGFDSFQNQWLHFDHNK